MIVIRAELNPAPEGQARSAAEAGSGFCQSSSGAEERSAISRGEASFDQSEIVDFRWKFIFKQS